MAPLHSKPYTLNPTRGDSPANLVKSNKVSMGTPQGRRRVGYRAPERVSNPEPPDFSTLRVNHYATHSVLYGVNLNPNLDPQSLSPQPWGFDCSGAILVFQSHAPCCFRARAAVGKAGSESIPAGRPDPRIRRPEGGAEDRGLAPLRRPRGAVKVVKRTVKGDPEEAVSGADPRAPGTGDAWAASSLLRCARRPGKSLLHSEPASEIPCCTQWKATRLGDDSIGQIDGAISAGRKRCAQRSQIPLPHLAVGAAGGSDAIDQIQGFQAAVESGRGGRVTALKIGSQRPLPAPAIAYGTQQRGVPSTGSMGRPSNPSGSP